MRTRSLICLIACLSYSTILQAQDGTVELFNGKDLSGFYTYMARTGKNNDPKNVVTVQDGMIRVSGELFGCFVTEKEYENYKLIVEFKWGDETFAPRKNRARDSGVLLHCIGEDGKQGGVWMESIETQIIEGGTGDFIVCRGAKARPRITVTTRRGPDNQLYFDPNGEPVTRDGGRVNWSKRDPNWRDVKDFRGVKDVEKPAGEWNTLEIICKGDTITNILNGVVVNKATNVTPTKGKILFQSEGAEIFFRKLSLTPLD